MSRHELLAVDDKPQNLFALKKLLRGMPVEVVTTTSPVEALGLALEHDFCVAIVDVQMPEMDGYELVSLLRANESTACLPVIFVSAIYSDEYHHRLGYEAGAVDFISKPFNPEILLSKIKVFMDLYAQRREMADLIGQLADANRSLRALNLEKDRLIGLAAHDLRTPLSNIRGFSELLALPDSGLPPENQEAMVRDIYRQAEYMLTLIDDLLEVSKIESGALDLRTEEVDLATFLSDLIVHHHQLAFTTKGSTVQLGEVPPVAITLDPIRLRQVVDNLVSNAVKFSPAGCRTVVDVEPAESGWRISVSDGGPGIAEEEQAQLFDYFCEISTVPTGGESSTGLGLAIAARIVRAHGGAIGVHSAPGEGSTFWFTIPAGKNGSGPVEPGTKGAKSVADALLQPVGNEKVR